MYYAIRRNFPKLIEFFTKRDQTILDPMAGTGSALVAALRCGRHSIGVELNPTYADIARQILNNEREQLGIQAENLSYTIITGNVKDFPQIAVDNNFQVVDYVITSPPYWNMLRATGAATQKKRRQNPGLDVVYSDDLDDLGNIDDYQQFLSQLVKIYTNLKPFVRSRGYLTIIVKNIKKGGRIYPLAWDLGNALSQVYTLKDERIWCQDDVRLAPYGMGNAWVSNTFHHYCLQFRNE